MTRGLAEVVRCPLCRGQLAWEANEVRCIACSRAWPVEDGTPFFYEGSYHFRAGRDEDIEALLRAAAQGEGKREVSARFSVGLRSKWFLEDSRADGALLTPIHPERTVALEVGAGFGGVALPLARLARDVFAVDPSAAGIRFLAARARAERQGNLHSMTADGLKLPFDDGSFDLVLLNGCLEWVPVSRLDLSPDEAQAAALREAGRVLKPGGSLYLAIENRFGAKYLLGARDEHTGMRFVTPLPRALANLMSRARRGKDYRERTQSADHLARLLREAGLELRGIHAPLRDYRIFRFLVDCGDAGALGLLVRRAMPFPTRSARIFLAGARASLALGLPRATSKTIRTVLYPSIALVGAKAGAAREPGWIDEAVREDFGTEDARRGLIVSSRRAATVFVYSSKNEEPVGVVRIQRRPDARDWVKNEFDFLQLIAGLADPTVASSVPRAIRLREAAGATLATQEFVAGAPLRARTRGAGGSLIAVRRWLLALGRAAVRPPATPGTLAQFLAGPMARIDLLVRDREIRMRRRWEAVRRTAAGLPAPPLVPCHFDLCPSNILFQGGAVRVVDWEYARWSWAPYDWFRFLFRFSLDASGIPLDMRNVFNRDEPVLGCLRRAFYRPGPFSDCVREHTLAFLTASGFPAKSVAPVFILATLEYLLLQVPLRCTDGLVGLLLGERNVFEGNGP